MTHLNFSRACFIVIQALSINVFAESAFILHEKGHQKEGINPALFYDNEDVLSQSKLDSYIAESQELQNKTHPLSLEETLYLRRISANWKEKKFEDAKKEILSFLNLFPTSSVRDPLFAMLGDLYFHEKDYNKASTTYSQILTDAYKERTFLSELRSLYELKNYAAVCTAGMNFLKSPIQVDKSKIDHVKFLTAESFYILAKEGVDLDLAKKGKDLYETLGGTKYEEASLYPLSQLHLQLGEHEEAAAIYIKLAERFPNKKEEILLQTAQLQLNFDREEAAKTYLRICELGGQKAPIAAYNLLTLLFDAKSYEKIIEAKDSLLPLVAEEQKATAEWYIGWSYYSAQDYKNAAIYLDEFASSEKEGNEQLKTALLSLVNCAEKQRDLSLFNKTLSLLRTYYQDDPVIAKALLIRAQLFADKNELVNSLSDLKEINSRFPDFEENETVAFNLALLLCQDKQWEESRKSFSDFLEKYPESEKSKPAFRHMLFASIQNLKTHPDQKEAFIQDLEWVLPQKDVLSEKEKEEYSFVLIKTLYELNEYEKAQEELNVYLKQAPAENLAEAHLLMATCEKKRVGLTQIFITHAEKALELKPLSLESTNIHLQLFNAYLLSNQFDEAAEHLHLAAKQIPIKEENKAWLANYYYGKAKNSTCKLSQERAIFYMEPLLSSLSPANEADALKLSSLYGKASEFDKQINLLKNLNLEQKEKPGGWKFQRQTLFELAKAYEAYDEKEDALSIYESLADLKIGASYISNAALLQKMRLKFALLPTERRNEKDAEFTEILNGLKDLELSKKLSSEPIHFEAALDYATILSSISDPEFSGAAECYLYQLKKIQEDFSSQESPFVKDYYSNTSEHPEKEALVKNYLRFVDAEILRNEALLSQNEGKKAKELKETAFSELENLSSASSMNGELKKRIANSLDLLK